MIWDAASYQHHTNHSVSTVVRNYSAALGTGWAQHVDTFSRDAQVLQNFNTTRGRLGT